MGTKAGLLWIGLGLLSCSSGPVSPCHEMRKCVTLSCREQLKEGISSRPWLECVRWCRESRSHAKGSDALCAQEIGVTCIRDWYGLECIAARLRCESGNFREDPDRC